MKRTTYLPRARATDDDLFLAERLMVANDLAVPVDLHAEMDARGLLITQQDIEENDEWPS